MKATVSALINNTGPESILSNNYNKYMICKYESKKQVSFPSTHKDIGLFIKVYYFY